MDDTVRSRRSILIASLAGLGGLAAQALGRPVAVRAGSDGDVVLGGMNDAPTTTTIRNTANTQTVLSAESSVLGSTGMSAVGRLRGLYANGSEAVVAEGDQHGVRASGAAYGVVGNAMGNGHAGVFGWSDAGYGLKGQSDTSIGVFGTSGTKEGLYGTSGTGAGIYGQSTAGPGILGASGSQSQPGVIGWSGATGVFGASGGSSGLPATPPVKTGVFGFAAQDSAAVGVHGRSTVGTGVRAQADVAGTALRVEGKATFSRSGVVTVAAGKSSATKSVVGLTSSSLVFAVIRTGDGQAFVRKVQPTAGSFTVYVNKVLSSTTTIAWIAFG